MCKQCVEAVNDIFPELSEKEQMDILWDWTAFPAASPEHIKMQLESYAESMGAIEGIKDYGITL